MVIRGVWWLMLLGALVWGGLGGCATEAGHQPGADFGVAVTTRDPVLLASLVESVGSPERTREEADRLLVQTQGRGVAVRLGALERVVGDRRDAGDMRIYALDQLAEADGQRAARALGGALPDAEGDVLAAFAKAAGGMKDRALIGELARSLARCVPASREALARRPEWGAVEAISGGPVDAAMMQLLLHEDSEVSRIAAMDILPSISGAKGVMAAVEGDQEASDPFDNTLRWWISEFGTLPFGGNEWTWVEMLRRPEQGAMAAAAVKRHRALLGRARYEMAPRFVHLLANLEDDPPGFEELAGQLGKKLAGLSHVRRQPEYLGAVDDVDESLAGNLSKLSLCDLLAMRELLRALGNVEFVRELRRLGDEDFADRTSEHGGLLMFSADHLLRAKIYPPLYTGNDFAYYDTDEHLRDTACALAQFHFHFQQKENGERAGPGAGDLAYVKTARCNCVVITSVSAQAMDIDYYTPGGAVVDLGIYEVK